MSQEIELTKLAYTKAELAVATGLSIDSVSDAMKRGDLVARYFGTKPIIPVKEAQRWVDSMPEEKPARSA